MDRRDIQKFIVESAKENATPKKSLLSKLKIFKTSGNSVNEEKEDSTESKVDIETKTEIVQDLKNSETKNKKVIQIKDKDFQFITVEKLKNFQTYLYLGFGLIMFSLTMWYLPIYSLQYYSVPRYFAPVGTDNEKNSSLINRIQTIQDRKPHNYNSNLDNLSLPSISANQVELFEINSQQIVYENNINNTQPIASITKLMTAMILLDNYELDEEITFLGDFSGLSVSIGIEDGDKMKVQDILDSILIQSANDVAEGSAVNFKGGGDAFYQKVDEKLQLIGLQNSYFRTASGIYDGNNYSTASDVKKIVKVALTYPEIREAASKKGRTVQIIKKDGQVVSVDIGSTNQLIYFDSKIKGLKTGYTEVAGQCFVALYDMGDGREYVSILLNSYDRFGETELLMQAVQ